GCFERGRASLVFAALDGGGETLLVEPPREGAEARLELVREHVGAIDLLELGERLERLDGLARVGGLACSSLGLAEALADAAELFAESLELRRERAELGRSGVSLLLRFVERRTCAVELALVSPPGVLGRLA